MRAELSPQLPEDNYSVDHLWEEQNIISSVHEAHTNYTQTKWIATIPACTNEYLISCLYILHTIAEWYAFHVFLPKEITKKNIFFFLFIQTDNTYITWTSKSHYVAMKFFRQSKAARFFFVCLFFSPFSFFSALLILI